MPVYPRAARFVFARATDQGQPEGAKGVVLHLSTSQATPLGMGMLQPLRGGAPPAVSEGPERVTMVMTMI